VKLGFASDEENGMICRALVRTAFLGLLVAGVGACAVDAGESAEESSGEGSEALIIRPPPGMLDAILHAAGRRSAPDFNGDGIPDLVVTGGNSDKIDVYHGTGSGYPATPTQIITSPVTGTHTFFGASNAGDVNKDGKSDLVVGSVDDNAAYLYLGSSAGLPSTPSQVIPTPAGADGFGWATLGGADFDGDGYADVAVSAPFTNQGKGAVYVFRGSASGLVPTPWLVLTGSGMIGSNFGQSLAVGDVSGDGKADLVVGEASNDWDVPTYGYVWIFDNSGGTLVSSKVLACPDGGYKGFGYAVAIVNDFDGDKAREIAVGAYGVNGNDGRVYLMKGGGTGITTSALRTFNPPVAGASGYFGFSLKPGDFNNDLYGDLVVGETDADGARGKAHVFYGTTGAGVLTRSFSGTHTGVGYFGQGLTTTQLSSGALDSLVVGAPWVNNRVGRAYVFANNGADVAGSPSLTLEGPNGTLTNFGQFFAY
jgi:hypothetical protein